MATNAQIQAWLRANPNATRAQMQSAMRQHGVTARQAGDAMSDYYNSLNWVGNTREKRAAQEQAVRLAAAAAPTAGSAYQALRQYGILSNPNDPRGAARDAQLIGRAAGPGVNMGGAQSVIRTIDPYRGLGMRNGEQQAWGVGGKTFGPASEMAGGMQPGQMRNIGWDAAAQLAQWGSRPTYSPYRPWAPGEGAMPQVTQNPYVAGQPQFIGGGSPGTGNQSWMTGNSAGQYPSYGGNQTHPTNAGGGASAQVGQQGIPGVPWMSTPMPWMPGGWAAPWMGGGTPYPNWTMPTGPYTNTYGGGNMGQPQTNPTGHQMF